MYVKKLTSFYEVIKKMHTKENWFLFSASWCIVMYNYSIVCGRLMMQLAWQ